MSAIVAGIACVAVIAICVAPVIIAVLLIGMALLDFFRPPTRTIMVEMQESGPSTAPMN